VMQPQEDPVAATRETEDLMKRLEILSEDLVTVAYIDLLSNKF
jgi:hypothetical protein